MGNYVKSFAKKLRGARAEADLTLDQLATLIGRTSATLSRWENGEVTRTPNIEMIRTLEEVLENGELLTAAGYTAASVSAPDNTDTSSNEPEESRYEQLVAKILRVIEDDEEEDDD